MISVTIVFRKNIPFWQKNLLILLLFETFVLVVALFGKKIFKGKFQFINYLYPWFFVPSIYELLRYYIHAIFPNLFDPLINRFELKIFGVFPTLFLQRFVSDSLTEIMAFGYFSYYLIFIFPPVIFWLYRRKNIPPFVFSVTFAYYICFLLFVLFPVSGPRFSLKDRYSVALGGYFIPKFQKRLMEKFALCGAAFPSSHVAMVISSLIMAKKYIRWLYYTILPLAIMVCLGAIYGRYHYVTDVLAGLLVGLFSAFFAEKIYEEKIKG